MRAPSCGSKFHVLQTDATVGRCRRTTMSLTCQRKSSSSIGTYINKNKVHIEALFPQCSWHDTITHLLAAGKPAWLEARVACTAVAHVFGLCVIIETSSHAGARR